jgi:phosphoadenosine phosphosulfate reductase
MLRPEHHLKQKQSMGAVSLYARPSASFEQKLQASKVLLRSAAAQYAPLTQASSLGAEDMVVTHLVAETGIASSIFVLDTRMLHAQTLALVGRLQQRYQRKVDIYQPDPAVAANFVAEHGTDAMYKSLELRKACCDFRKMVPLERALAGKKGWITGLRREQSNARAEVHDVEQQNLVIDGATVSRVKVNPLADWTWGDVWHFISLHNIPYNPLHDEFFPSIGCAPCTRAVTPGEDFRSGRWWWEQESAKECGLHVATDGSSEAQEPAAFEPLSSLHPGRASIIPIREIPA